MATHGTVGAALAASADASAPDAGVRHLCAVHEALRSALRANINRRPILSSGQAVADYLMVTIGHRRTERIQVLFLDAANHLIADETMSSGTTDAAAIYPREVIHRALELGATALILAHNHPSGDPRPSPQDVAVTRSLGNAGQALSIAVHDHIIVSPGGCFSMRAEGLL